MKLRTRIALVIGLLVVVAAVLNGVLVYNAQSKALIDGINSKLLATANLAREILPTDYHDNISGPDSVSKEEYLRIVDRWNRLCVELGLEYIWSLMIVDGEIVFTSGSSTSKDIEQGDHALFFETHSNPEKYEETFQTMEPRLRTIEDKWGRIQVALVPFRDAKGRKYLFGASMKTAEVDALARETLWKSLGVASLTFGLGMGLALLLAGSLSRPIEKLTRVAKFISEGHYDRGVESGSIEEISSLSQSINAMSRSVQEQIERLEEQKGELERYSYTVSHDLKSPLITIKGYVGILREDLVERDEARIEDDLQRISDAADKMELLLKNLLELSRIGRLVNPPEDVPLAEVVEEALENVRGQLEAGNVAINVSSDLPVAFGDRMRLVEVFQNLIDNGVKYMGDQTDPRIDIGVRRDDEKTVVFVRDNGVGVDARYHEQIFGLFNQLNQSAEGSGIGLALIKRIIEVHGGHIWVESEGLGHGSTFCFTIEKEESKPASNS